MGSGRRYRVASVLGTVAISVIAALLANSQAVQQFITTYVPLFWRLEPTTLTGSDLYFAVALSSGIVLAAVWPLYKPIPRRVLDTVALTHRRVVLAGLALATLGYFNWSYRLPRATLLAVVVILGLLLPAWFVTIRQTVSTDDKRVLLVGDDLQQMDRIISETDIDPIGYLSPSSTAPIPKGTEQIARKRSVDEEQTRADGGDIAGTTELSQYTRLGGLSGLEYTIEQEKVDTVVCAFQQADRGEFFHALEVCYERGMAVKVHRDYADDVLTASEDVGTLVDVDVKPWDTQDYLLKRVFDVGFAGTGLLFLSPVILFVAIAIKLDSKGPVFYKHDRTAAFGETFPVYKFRSMVVNAEEKTGAKISEEDAGGVDPRVTRVGRYLRKTHMDEIPQLWSILKGDMSVVGPRPERPEIDQDIQLEGIQWSKRWFIKPGLTGLAQINDVTGHEPAKKLRYDIQYIREQSFWFDVKIVIRQIWKVLRDVIATARGSNDESKEHEQ